VALDPIDQLLALDLGGRGIAAFFVPGGAGAAAAALRPARRVLIATGFTVAADTPETDGPPGAAVLGRALRCLGAEVRYVTDAHNVPILEAALKVLDEPIDIAVYPGDRGAEAMLAREQPTHLVAVERPGRARSGEYLNLRGETITAWNGRIDDLFLLAHRLPRNRSWAPSRSGRARRAPAAPARPRHPAEAPVSLSRAPLRRPVTIGVGDGGNEIGMGNVRRRLLRRGGLLARTASIVCVDHLVVAAASNWGAYGIVAALARQSGEDLLHSPETERRLVRACAAAGAFDGVTRRREPTVDGMPVETHAAVVELLARTPRTVSR
jgi:hypothetical protein